MEGKLEFDETQGPKTVEPADTAGGLTADDKNAAASEIDTQNMDENVFKQDTELLGVAADQKFRCINPQNKGGHISYNCYGVDKQGEWEGLRRYREFHKLHEELVKRWPGVPVPQIPPKKNIGNKDVKFINERRFYLERFMKKMASYPFILNSDEFLAFSRPGGNNDIEKALTKLPVPTTTQILDRFKEAIEVEDFLYNML